MALSAFDDRSQEPRDEDLRKTLGRSGARWEELIAHVGAAHGPLTVSWGHAGAKWGWTLRLKCKKRTILYMTPCRRHFLVGFVLGEKAVRAARALPLEPELLKRIDEAPRYPEGRGVRIEVRTRKDVESVRGLAAIKMAN